MQANVTHNKGLSNWMLWVDGLGCHVWVDWIWVVGWDWMSWGWMVAINLMAIVI